MDIHSDNEAERPREPVPHEDLVQLLTCACADGYFSRQELRWPVPDHVTDPKCERALADAVARGLVTPLTFDKECKNYFVDYLQPYEGSWATQPFPCQYFYITKSGLDLVRALPISFRCKYSLSSDEESE